MKYNKINQFFACGKPWYKKWWIYVVAVITFLFLIPCGINEVYKAGLTAKNPYITMWGADDLLSFYGSFLAFAGTVGLGGLALWQNYEFKIQNDIFQEKLEKFNNYLLALDIDREQKNILEMYFNYMEEITKIFNPEYVLQEVCTEHNFEKIFFRIKKAEMNATSIKRRLLFIDAVGVEHNFFEYCSEKSQELIYITQQANKTSNQKVTEIFGFWRSNSEKFNTNSLEFIYDTNSRLKREEK